MPKTEEGTALGYASFWAERYSKVDDSRKPTYESFRDFVSLEPIFSKHLFASQSPEPKPRIFLLGSGDSLMESRYAADDVVECEESDIRDMKDIAPSSIDVAFDQGTLKAMILPILNRNDEWDLEMEILGGGDSFEYYGHRVAKRKVN
ncbi:hypothetical protein T440DRAFT_484632 [Plenodomus tracheiphilus IPT5]|uniref:Uncharacterized protein n=1 Tax=Plenodomus tracheiphilus IPT5 TaxID=1408161 RepID=A0A6A7BPN5_9PLEO|nr:hypothetical protein T440DRAFT_484632 [Plenodomus tracheiphilus IPT5]